MTNEYVFIGTSQYIKETTKWLKALKRKENVSVIFIPKTDRLIRYAHLLNDKKLLHEVLSEENKYHFINIEVDAHDTEEYEDLTFQINEHLNSSRISSPKQSFDDWLQYFKNNSLHMVLVVPEAERYLNTERKNVLHLLSKLSEKCAPILQILSFFETNFLHPSFSTIMPSSTGLYQNIFNYPLYTFEETSKFINLLENLWHITISTKERMNIYQACGGHFWFVKQAVREIAGLGKWSINSEGMMFRMQVVFNLMLPSERNMIKKIISGKKNFNDEEQISLAFFKKMNVVDSNNKCLITGYENLLSKHTELKNEFMVIDNNIFLNQVMIDKIFSRKEHRVIKLFLSKKDMIVSRNEIAKAIWPLNTLENYSDWAIDQMISRLRKRLKQLMLPKILEVIRGQGYRLNLQQSSI